MSAANYPWVLRPWARESIWGGRGLERYLFKSLPAGKKIGETWEAWDECVVENGERSGSTVGRLIQDDPPGVLGAASTVQGKLPLLFKFIDAQDDLSLQVHPDDQAARALENYPFGKTEAWYIVHAEPGAHVIHGFEKDATPELARDYVRRDKLAELLTTVEVATGDVIFVPAGTVHAIGRGIVLAEIQENSDLTYRLYDWGRLTPDGKSRELHIDRSLKVADYDSLAEHKIEPLIVHRPEFDRTYLVACRYFSFERFEVRSAFEAAAPGDRFVILTVIDGQAEITFGQGLRSCVPVKHGQTVLLPASLGPVGIAPKEGPCRLLRAYAPDLVRDVIDPLISEGHSKEDIAKLGGSRPQSNDVASILRQH
ncbi:MAG: class I mannose-6-phosphate isomerase [Chloroflexi bacterium]|nr:class I mannose-6-phosphate isomerase [Chloroflexota bacterium]